jgi:hypothetical protein
LLPTYGLYCASVNGARPPWAWFRLIVNYPQWSAPLVAVALVSLWMSRATWRARLSLLTTISIVIGLLLGLCCITYALVPVQPSSVWIPRYLGVVWPAFAIAVATLLMRLPTRPIRWSVIALFISLNLVRHFAFVFVGCEPPIQRLADDIMAARAADASTRAYPGIVNPWLVGPGDAFFTPTLPCYLYASAGMQVRPLEYTTRWRTEFAVTRVRAIPQSTIARDVLHNPKLTHIVLWDESAAPTSATSDPVLKQLGGGWTRASEEVFPTFERWTWRKTGAFRRRVYQRR